MRLPLEGPRVVYQPVAFWIQQNESIKRLVPLIIASTRMAVSFFLSFFFYIVVAVDGVFVPVSVPAFSTVCVCVCVCVCVSDSV